MYHRGLRCCLEPHANCHHCDPSNRQVLISKVIKYEGNKIYLGAQVTVSSPILIVVVVVVMCSGGCVVATVMVWMNVAASSVFEAQMPRCQARVGVMTSNYYLIVACTHVRYWASYQ